MVGLFVLALGTAAATTYSQPRTTNAATDLAATVNAIALNVWDCNPLAAPAPACREMHDALDSAIGRVLHLPTQTCTALIPIMSLPYMDLVSIVLGRAVSQPAQIYSTFTCILRPLALQPPLSLCACVRMCVRVCVCACACLPLPLSPKTHSLAGHTQSNHDLHCHYGLSFQRLRPGRSRDEEWVD
jgi:hypothetical protein